MQHMQSNQHLQHPRKHKKQPETWEQVSQWMAENSMVKTGRNQVDKKKRKKSGEKEKRRCSD